MGQEETFESMVREASALRRASRVPEAIAAYRRLLARWPDKAESWYNLALLERHGGEFEAALESYQQALDRGAAQPEEIHLNRGVIYADHLRRDAAAERELLAALALNPAYVPALVNLANLHEDRGNRDEALALYERAGALAPHSGLVLARLANLSRIDAPGDALVVRLRGTIADLTTPAADRAVLGFALGKLLDECGAYDEAFAAYEDANRASRECALPGIPLYDRDAQERLVDEVIATLTPDMFHQAASVPSPAIFICGMFRSGSTLTEQVLAAHPRVTSGGELDIVPSLVRGALSSSPAAVKGMSPARFEELARHYRDTVAKMFPSAALVTDKRPDNFLYLGLIKLMFPDAKIVHTVRDPLDNCLSMYFLHLDHRMGYALDLMDIGHYYGQYRRLMAHWKSLFGKDILDFDYDEFVRESEPAARRLLAFCGLGWDDNCLAFHRTESAVKTASVWQVREPLYTRASGRARNYERHLLALRAFLAGGQ